MAALQRNTPKGTSNLAGYSGTPLPKKLGIKSGFRVLLIDAPRDFETTLGRLEAEAALSRFAFRAALPKLAGANLALWFVESLKRLEKGVQAVAKNCPASGVWICWKKKTAMTKEQAANALGEADVRRAALQAGLVDFKVCAIDATWSGLKFVPARRAK